MAVPCDPGPVPGFLFLAMAAVEALDRTRGHIMSSPTCDAAHNSCRSVNTTPRSSGVRTDCSRTSDAPCGSSRIPGQAQRLTRGLVMIDRKPTLKYRGVEVIAAASACDAARSVKNVRLLSAEAPRLPLATCDRPAICKCIYRHFDERRQGPRRENEHATVTFAHQGTEWRKRPGRRDSDYA